MPAIQKGESQKDYVSRCIPTVMKEGGKGGQKHAITKCYGMYRQHEKTGANYAAEMYPPPVKQTFAGLDIRVENPVGSVRKGVSKKGKPWSVKMSNSYGFLARHKGEDGEGLDVFLGPDEKAGNVYVVHQNNPDTGEYDEDKTMLGFPSGEAAKKAYLSNYDSPKFFRSITEIPVETFKQMLTNGKPGGLHWKKKMGREHETTAMFSAEPHMTLAQLKEKLQGGVAFAGDDENAHWVTIGAQEGDDGKKHGGTPVQIGGSGNIEKGPGKLTGKNVNRLGKSSRINWLKERMAAVKARKHGETPTNEVAKPVTHGPAPTGSEQNRQAAKSYWNKRKSDYSKFGGMMGRPDLQKEESPHKDHPLLDKATNAPLEVPEEKTKEEKAAEQQAEQQPQADEQGEMVPAGASGIMPDTQNTGNGLGDENAALGGGVMPDFPHQMPVSDYLNSYKQHRAANNLPVIASEAVNAHEKSVADALKAGHNVPPEVLKDYAHLQAPHAHQKAALGETGENEQLDDKEFKPATIRYKSPDGTPLVLRVDRVHGHKSYWIEDENGKKLLKPTFYNKDAISDILESGKQKEETPAAKSELETGENTPEQGNFIEKRRARIHELMQQPGMTQARAIGQATREMGENPNAQPVKQKGITKPQTENKPGVNPFENEKVGSDEVYGKPPEGLSNEDWAKAVQNRMMDMERRVYGHDPKPAQMDVNEKMRNAKAVLRENPKLAKHYVENEKGPEQSPAPQPAEQSANTPAETTEQGGAGIKGDMKNQQNPEVDAAALIHSINKTDELRRAGKPIDYVDPEAQERGKQRLKEADAEFDKNNPRTPEQEQQIKDAIANAKPVGEKAKAKNKPVEQSQSTETKSHIPELNDGSGSWIVTRKSTGEPVGEFYDRKSVERFDPSKVDVKTAMQHLKGLNSKIKPARQYTPEQGKALKARVAALQKSAADKGERLPFNKALEKAKAEILKEPSKEGTAEQAKQSPVSENKPKDEIDLPVMATENIRGDQYEYSIRKDKDEEGKPFYQSVLRRKGGSGNWEPALHGRSKTPQEAYQRFADKLGYEQPNMDVHHPELKQVYDSHVAKKQAEKAEKEKQETAAREKQQKLNEYTNQVNNFRQSVQKEYKSALRKAGLSQLAEEGKAPPEQIAQIQNQLFAKHLAQAAPMLEKAYQETGNDFFKKELDNWRKKAEQAKPPVEKLKEKMAGKKSNSPAENKNLKASITNNGQKIGAVKFVETPQGGRWLLAMYSPNGDKDKRFYYRSFDQAYAAAYKKKPKGSMVQSEKPE